MLGVLAVGILVALAAGDLDGQRADEPARPPLPPQVSRGFNVTAYAPDAFAAPPAFAALRALRDLGTTDVVLPVLWFSPDRRASTIAPDPDETPTDASVLAAAAEARRLGMRVTVAPHLSIRDGSFRGEIAPRDPDAWFADYAVMVDRFATLAAQARAATMVLGSELTSMTTPRFTRRWRALASRARARFGGRLTFASNWVQGAEQIRFWDVLDVVGVDAYMPLARAGEDDPSIPAIRAAWRPWIDRMRRLSEREGKPILLTEVGFTSRRGTAGAPFEENPGPVDVRPQTRAVAATFEALGDEPWLEGMWWWERSADGRASPDDGGWSVAGKPAEAVVRRWFATG